VTKGPLSTLSGIDAEIGIRGYAGYLIAAETSAIGVRTGRPPPEQREETP